MNDSIIDHIIDDINDKMVLMIVSIDHIIDDINDKMILMMLI